MTYFVESHRNEFGVEPICKALQFAPSTFYDRLAIRKNPDLASKRMKRDAALTPKIKQIWKKNHCLYGSRKLWHAMKREGYDVARCTLERLMRINGLEGVRRGKKIKTTIPDKSKSSPLDLVKREFRAAAPNRLWVSDFTYVSTWQGFAYVAFVIDTFANRIVGWRLSNSPNTAFVLDALEQALYERRPHDKLIHHSDRGSQYLAIKYTERLKDAGIEPSVGIVGCSYDNALAETIIGLYKTEVINQNGPWKTREAVEWKTLKWVDWFNNERLLQPIGYIPPKEAEENYYANLNQIAKVA